MSTTAVAASHATCVTRKRASLMGASYGGRRTRGFARALRRPRSPRCEDRRGQPSAEITEAGSVAVGPLSASAVEKAR